MLRLSEAKRLADAAQRIRGGMNSPSLLKPGVPGDAHPGSRGHLVTAEPSRAPSLAARQPQILRAQPFTTATEQEVMSTLPGSKDSFTRISYFGYNAVNHQYEYFSLDTRAPQMMNERSLGASGGASASGPVNLLGGDFVAPQWGTTKNAAFRYRIVVGPIKDNRQEVELYLTPLSAEPRPEFLAFKYVYTRHAEHG
jgi:hypothetical protein